MHYSRNKRGNHKLDLYTKMTPVIDWIMKSLRENGAEP